MVNKSNIPYLNRIIKEELQRAQDEKLLKEISLKQLAVAGMITLGVLSSPNLSSAIDNPLSKSVNTTQSILSKISDKPEWANKPIYEKDGYTYIVGVGSKRLLEDASQWAEIDVTVKLMKLIYPNLKKSEKYQKPEIVFNDTYVVYGNETNDYINTVIVLGKIKTSDIEKLKNDAAGLK